MIDKMKDLAAALTVIPGTRVELNSFPTGAAMLDVWRSGRLFVMEYSPARRFGVDEVKDGEGFLLSSRYTYGDFEPAAERLKQLVQQAVAEAATPGNAAPSAPVPPTRNQVVTAVDKRAELLALARKRQTTRWSGYCCVGDYHDGVYECDFVSPYTKTAGNVDAEILVMLQDWDSDISLNGPIGHIELGYNPKLPTNRNLARLLKETFGKNLQDVYGTNLFPFIKRGGMSEPIPQEDLVRAAHEFALPQIRIVHPRLVICLGLDTFNALRHACGLALSSKLSAAIGSPFDLDDVRVWCQAHTGHWGQVNRNRAGAGQVSKDWQAMKADFDARRVAAIG